MAWKSLGVTTLFDGSVADFVGGAVGHAALDSAAGKPDGEPLAVVVAPGAARRAGLR